MTSAFRDSLFGRPRASRVASARAGNVIGGGDWTDGRLVPDLIRACLDGTPLEVRAPDAIRPWQHVLNPLYGYLLLAEAAVGGPDRRDGVELRPRPGGVAPRSGWLVERLAARWPGEVDGRGRRAAAAARVGGAARRQHAGAHAASAGGRRGTCPPRSTPPSTGTSPTATAGTSRSSRSSASPPSSVGEQADALA